MSNHIKKVLFLASMALNVAFTATYLAYKIPSMATFNEDSSRQPVFLQLDLTPEQSQAFGAERDRFRVRLQEWGKEVKTLQIELIRLLEMAPPDPRAIERKQDEIQRVQKVVQDGVIAHVQHVGSLLKPEQRARFFRLIKDRIDNSIQVCPPWMRPSDGKQTGEGKHE